MSLLELKLIKVCRRTPAWQAIRSTIYVVAVLLKSSMMWIHDTPYKSLAPSKGESCIPVSGQCSSVKLVEQGPP